MKIRLFESHFTYGNVESVYLPTLSIPIALYIPGPGTEAFFACSSGSTKV
jgi:hypothetical protein